MKTHLILAAAAALLVGCDARVTPLPSEKTVEKNTTIVNPPGKEENKTIIVNPPAKEETKIEKKTIIVNPPAPTTTEEKKTTTTVK